MRRRIAVVLASLAATVALAGCTGADAQKAETILNRAEVAQRSVTSERFVLRFGIDAEGQSMTLAVQGGGYLKGPRAGDFYATMTGTGLPTTAGTDMTVVRRGGSAAIRTGGRTMRMSAGAAERRYGSPTDLLLDLTRYVTSVSVGETSLGGAPADEIVGTLDTKALLASAGGLSTQLLDATGVDLGDIRAVLLVPRDTHLVQVLLADFDVSAHGHEAHLHMSLAIDGVDRPVAIPSL